MSAGSSDRPPRRRTDTDRFQRIEESHRRMEEISLRRQRLARRDLLRFVLAALVLAGVIGLVVYLR